MKKIITSISVIMTATLVVSGLFIFSPVLAAATVTPASGGTNISIDTTSASGGDGTFVLLGGPGITENEAGDIAEGTHTITLPVGWEFDTTSTISIFNFNIVLGSTSIVPDTNSFSFTVTQASTEKGMLGFSSLKVRPTGTDLTDDDMTYSGAGIVGVDEHTNFGTLSTVAGIVTQLAFTTQPSDTVYGSILSPSPVVETQDQFGNHSTNELGESKTVTLELDSETGVLHGTLSLDIGTSTNNGVITFTDLTVDHVGVDNILTASADGLTPADSEHFDITPAHLTITADDKTKVYGESNPLLTASYTGLVGGDTSAVVSGLSLTAVDDTTTPVGPIAITPSGATADNYNISFVSGVLTITQAPLTITADVQAKVYGENDPGFSYQITSGALVEGGDGLTGPLSRVAGENVGTYAINQGSLDNSNYDITFESANLTISKKAITVTAVTDTKTYDGDTTSSAIPTTESLAFEDIADFVQTYDNKNVGENKILTPSGLVDDGNSGNNYNYSYVINLTGTITQAPLTITADDKTKVYGESNPLLTASYTGLVGGDTSAVVSGLSLTAVDDTTTPVGPIAITPSGATADNYNISFVSGVLTITQAPLTITADVQAKVYGENDPGFSYQITSGALVEGGDGLTGPLSRVAGENVGTYAINQGSLDNSNYDITFESANLTISKKAITVTAVTDTKIYDSNTTSDETPIITGSLVSGDTAGFVQTYDNKNEGEGKTLTPSGAVIDGNSGLNYSYDFVTDTTGVITQAILTATITVVDKVVDGNTSATITGRTLIGVISGDDVSVNEDGTATFADASIGLDKVVTAAGITITGDDAGNYFFDGTATGTGNILPVPTIVYVDDNFSEGNAGEYVFSYNAFATIQDGIEAVDVNGTINVAAGTYIESLTVDKTLSIIGVGDTTIIQPVQDSNGFDITADGVTIQDLKIITSNSGTDPNMAIKIEGTDSVTISGTTIETTGDKALGIWIGTSASTNLNILNNVITINNESTGIYGAKVNPAHSGWTIGGSEGNANTVTVLLGNPIELYDISASEVSYNTITTSVSGGSAFIWSSEMSDLSDLIFNYNTVNYSGGSQVAFLADFQDVLGTGLPPDTTVTTVTITGNTFDNWGSRGLRIGDGVTGVTASGNKFLHTGEALKNEDASAVTAEENWWGTAVSATIAGKIVNAVDYEPYYVDSGMTILSNTSVDTVYVDNNYLDGLGNDGHYFGYNAFTTIQDGIDAVEGSTVNVAAGTYDESLLIEKPLTLIGTEEKPVIIGDDSINNYIIKVNETSNVVIDNIEVNGGGSGTGDNAFDYGILVNNSGTTENPIEIKNSIVKNIWNTSSNGIEIDNGSYVLIHHNIVSSFHKRGIRFINSEGKVYNNEVIGDNVDGTSRVQNLVNLWGGSTVEIYNNVLHNALTIPGTIPTWDSPGIFVSSYGGSGASYANIHDNEIYDCDSGIVIGSVYAETDKSSADITNNNLHNLKWAINFEKNTVSATITGNSFTNNEIAVNAEGFDPIAGPVVNAEGNWWGSVEGPTHADNPFGAGNVVANNNTDYRPWCTDAECNVIDETPPTAVLSNTPADSTNQTDLDIVVGNGDVVYYKYKLDGADYSIETLIATPITESVGEGAHMILVIGRDQAGNWQSEATTYSWTVDITDPTLTSVSITSDNANPVWAKVGDTITLTFTSSENIQTPNVTIAGKTAVVSGENTSWTVTYIMTSEDEDGAVVFTVDFADLAGNDGLQVADVTDASSVTFDKTAPVVEITVPTEGDEVNGSAVIFFTTDESSSQCSVDNENWTSCVTDTTTLSGITEFAGLAEGVFTLYLKDTDAAGNIGTDNISLTKDTIAPSVVSHVPTVNAMNVEPANDIVIIFSEAVIVETGDVVFDPAFTSFTIQNSGTETVTISLNEALDSNTAYTITLSGVTDLAGNVMNDYNNINFTTATFYDISLYSTITGWNLISLPVVPNDTAISTVLGDAATSIDEVWTYDPTHLNADDSGWLMYSPEDPAETNNLDVMTTGYGYWISATDNTSIEGWGSLLTVGPTVPPSRILNAGWNLIGYYQIPGEDSSDPSEAFASLQGSYTGLWGYDNTSTTGWKITVDTILPGDAFWISLPEGKTYSPSNL